MKPPISVVGAGAMGSGIAQVFALAGYPTTIYDAYESALGTVRERMRADLASRGADTAAVDEIAVVPDLAQAVGNAAFVFEAISERLDLKAALFARLCELTSASTVLASNTSVIPITHIAATSSDRSRILGTHWWNPPTLVPLVEVIETAEVAPEHVAATIALLQAVGKSAVHVRRDVTGFVGNRLQHALWREAIALVQAGVCDAATVDRVVKEGFGRRLAVLGPLENADLVGLDLTLDIHGVVLPDLDTTNEPQALLSEHVAAGRLGMKSGRGFYEWTPETSEAVRQRVRSHLATFAPT